MLFAKFHSVVVTLLLSSALWSCVQSSEDDSIHCDTCTATDLPSSAFIEGGEALLEIRYDSPGVTGRFASATQGFYAFQYGGSFWGAEKRPLAGQCTRIDATTYPFHDIAATAQYVDWGPDVRLTGSGLDAGVTVPKRVAESAPLLDNRHSSLRDHPVGGWIYGGPEWQRASFQDVVIEPGEKYTLELPEKRISLVFPEESYFPLGIGQEDIVLSDQEDLCVDLEEPVHRSDAYRQLKAHSFVLFTGYPEEGELESRPLWFCLPPEQDYGSTGGPIVVPAQVLADLPAIGLMQVGYYNHWEDAMTDDEGSKRRFDFFGMASALSKYEKASQ